MERTPAAPSCTLVDVVCHAERLALMLETREVATYLGRWALGRPSEIRLVATLAVADVTSGVSREFDAYVSLAGYLDELHGALVGFAMHDPPCCGGYTECAGALPMEEREDP